jgi:SAM-dependent methyltransferase
MVVNFCKKRNIVLSIYFFCGLLCLYASPQESIIYTLDQACSIYSDTEALQPELNIGGNFKTKNGKGVMDSKINELTHRFIEDALGKEVLEVGSAYGKVACEVLEKNKQTQYTLMEIDKKHLSLAAKNINDKAPGCKATFVYGDISDKEIQLLQKFEAILVAHVLHFLPPDKLENAVKNVFDLLKPEGKVYVSAVTPYVKLFEAFTSEYEKRVLSGDEFPGAVKSLRLWQNKIFQDLSHAIDIDQPFTFLNVPELTKAFEKAGFKVLECRLADIGESWPQWELDGKEDVILIAQKPGNS